MTMRRMKRERMAVGNHLELRYIVVSRSYLKYALNHAHMEIICFLQMKRAGICFEDDLTLARAGAKSHPLDRHVF